MLTEVQKPNAFPRLRRILISTSAMRLGTARTICSAIQNFCRALAAGSLTFTLFVAGALQCCWATQSILPAVQKLDSRADFQQHLRALAAYSPDPCNGPGRSVNDLHLANYEEERVFRASEAVLQDGLNSIPATSQSPRNRAIEVLSELSSMSTAIDAGWPEERRFQYEVIDLAPGLLVKITIRTLHRYVVFGIPVKNAGKPNQLWQEIGSDDERQNHNIFDSTLSLYPLYRSAAGNPRFLAEFIHTGCAGSIGVVYDAREWDPREDGALNQFIDLKGAFGLDDRVPGFEQIGKLRTEGPLITLPYCEFSAIDTWDNPSLCAVDTYDLSSDSVRFRSRVFNRPDLLPIAKAVEYAQQRDYEATRSYCASSEIAHRLVSDLPPTIFAEDVTVTHTGRSRERIKLASGYSFDVEKRSSRWIVVTFRAEQ